MDNVELDAILERVRAALERNDLASAATVIEALRPADQAEVFAQLGDDAQVGLLPRLRAADSADIVEKLPDEAAAELVAALPTDAVIRIVDEMEPDEAADLLGDMHPERARAVLAGLEDPDEVRPLLLHRDDSAGGLMTSEFLVLRQRMTAGQAIQALRDWKPDTEAIYYLYVVDRVGRLRGVVSLRQLIVADPGTPLLEIMDPEVISVEVGTHQEECARLMSRYDLLALPVVDADHVLLGVVTVDDVVDVLVEEATEDFHRLGGAQPLDRPYLETDIVSVFRKRIGWLMILFVGGSLTTSVMRHFEYELHTVLALAFFVPLLIGTGGNAGSQTISTLVRALGTGEIVLGDALRAVWHETRTGVLLGLAMGAIAFGRALTWGTGQELSLVVALTVLAVVVWANMVGSILPLLATRLGIDPAVVSGPVVTTLVDATGLFIYFSIARAVLGL